MTDVPVITARSTIGTWLAHPAGARIVAGIAQQGGIDESALALMRNIPVGRLLAGSMPDEAVAALVSQVNGGTVPDEAAATGIGWQERVSTGRFTGQTVIVTGAASGIGRAVASRIAREGGRVVAADLAIERLDALAAEHDRADVVAVAADITTADGVQAILAAAGERVDGLANVAGLLDDFSPIHEVSDLTLQRVFDVNVFGLVRLTRAVVPLMLAAGRGSIVNIASEAALRGSSAGLAYTASKSAVIGITRSSAFMYEQHGIRVNAVAPGGTLTGMRPGATSGFGKERLDSHTAQVPLAVPEMLAASITFLLSEDGVNVTGAILPSDGGESVF